MAPAQSDPGIIPGASKTPLWSCSCGQDGNWASRTRCRQRWKAAPTHVVQAAKLSAAAANGPAPSTSRPRGAWAQGPPGQGQLLAQLQQLQKQ
eukprot:2816129-Pyramimonas_sp.AAC.1